MHSYAFEIYIISLLIISRHPSLAEDLDNGKDNEVNIDQKQTTSPASQKSDDYMNAKGKISQLERYKKLFNEHRKMQLSAVKSMQRFGNQEAQFKLVNVMLTQLFKNLHDARQNLTLWGFLPGDEFPLNETIRESMSKVLENTALFGDMVLRMPKAVHEFYDRNREWQLLLAWSYGFCSQSHVFDSSSETLLNLMGQEVNLIPRSPDFVNPYEADEDPREKVPVSVVSKKSTKEKEKKKIPRGPRMSRTEL